MRLTKNPNPRPRNELWDVIVEIFGFNPVTKPDQTRIGRVVRDLKLKDATPELVRQLLAVYKRKWPEMTATPEALLKHWDLFLQELKNGTGHGGGVRRDSRIESAPGKYEGIGTVANGDRITASHDEEAAGSSLPGVRPPP